MEIKEHSSLVKWGDRNTKFFHRYANFRWNINFTWKISDTEGRTIYMQEEISDATVNHFQNAYRSNEDASVEDIVWGTKPYSNMFDQEKNEEFIKEVSEEKLLGVLKSFKSDKVSGLMDGLLNLEGSP